MANFKAQNRRLLPRFHQRVSKSIISSFKICFQNYGQRKIKFLRPKNTSSTFLKFELSSFSGPMLKTRENTIRNQFEQQWFDVISFQKPRRVYPAIWYNLKPCANRKGRFKLSIPAKCTIESRKFVKGQNAIINQINFKNHNVFALWVPKREWSKRANPPYMTLFPWKLFSIHSWFCAILRGYFKDATLLVG